MPKQAKSVSRSTKTTKRNRSKKKIKEADSGTIGYRHLPKKQKRFSLQKPPKNFKRLPDAFKITKTASVLIWQNRKLFIGIALIFGLLNLILVQGLASSTEISNLKNQLNKGTLGALTTSVSIFGVLIGSSGNGSSTTAGAYQMPLVVIASLAIIWALRQVKSDHKVSVKDAYYKGMYPLIPFTLVVLVVAVQSLPMVIGAALYASLVTNGIVIGAVENIAFLFLFLLLATWSIRLLSASIFALYIVTLPDMTPLKALRSAKQLVRFHRLSIFRKMIFLPILLLIVSGVVLLPIILLLTNISQWFFFVLTMLMLLFAHTYLYTIYREMLNE
ncbi:MAG TPA: hypothetical protein VFN31_02735 [Candidatus Saccharimonadales bacterium]|nr:hypothetical protein [Candidatus Saccharimonadales bacterium]